MEDEMTTERFKQAYNKLPHVVERNNKRHVIRLTDEGKEYLKGVVRAYLLHYPEQSGDVFDEVMNELDIN
jgi:DNA-binding PadR family transcriptional regulator